MIPKVLLLIPLIVAYPCEYHPGRQERRRRRRLSQGIPRTLPQKSSEQTSGYMGHGSCGTKTSRTRADWLDRIVWCKETKLFLPALLVGRLDRNTGLKLDVINHQRDLQLLLLLFVESAKWVELYLRATFRVEEWKQAANKTSKWEASKEILNWFWIRTNGSRRQELVDCPRN